MTKALAVKAALAILAVATVVAAAALLWLTPWETTRWETQEAHGQHVALACDKTAVQTYFDLDVSVTTVSSDGTPDVKDTAEVRVAGLDFEVQQEGDSLGVDSVYVDGVGYARLGDEPWRVSKAIDANYLPRYLVLELTPEGLSLCPEFASSIEKVGEVVLDGVRTTHYRSWHDLSPAYPNYKAGITLNYWLDSTDLLVQISLVETVTPKAGRDLPSMVKTIVAKVVGVGEPNVITAPVVSGQ